MNRRLTGPIILSIALMTVTFGVTIGYQQAAIDALVHSQSVETARAVTQSREIARLHRELDDHLRKCHVIELEHERSLEQLDLLMAASRSGWRKADRLLRSWEPHGKAVIER